MHNSSHVQKSDARTRVEQGVKSKTLSKQVFSTENCYVQFGVVLGFWAKQFLELYSQCIICNFATLEHFISRDAKKKMCRFRSFRIFRAYISGEKISKSELDTTF